MVEFESGPFWLKNSYPLLDGLAKYTGDFEMDLGTGAGVFYPKSIIRRSASSVFQRRFLQPLFSIAY